MKFNRVLDILGVENKLHIGFLRNLDTFPVGEFHRETKLKQKRRLGQDRNLTRINPC